MLSDELTVFVRPMLAVVEGSWLWDSGAKLLDAAAAWAPNEPNNAINAAFGNASTGADEDCVSAMVISGGSGATAAAQWFDVPCRGYVARPICQRECASHMVSARLLPPTRLFAFHTIFTQDGMYNASPLVAIYRASAGPVSAGGSSSRVGSGLAALPPVAQSLQGNAHFT